VKVACSIQATFHLSFMFHKKPGFSASHKQVARGLILFFHTPGTESFPSFPYHLVPMRRMRTQFKCRRTSSSIIVQAQVNKTACDAGLSGFPCGAWEPETHRDEIAHIKLFPVLNQNYNIAETIIGDLPIPIWGNIMIDCEISELLK
jgi:hypothetical protein